MKTFLVACYGRKELRVILPPIDAISAVYVAEGIRFRVRTLKITIMSSDGFGGIIVSIGLALLTLIPRSDLATLIALPAQMVCRATLEGRNALSYSNSQISYTLKASLVTFVVLATAYLFRMQHEGIWTLNCSKFSWLRTTVKKQNFLRSSCRKLEQHALI
ncbi:MAG TPA: hypothetical protein V6D14_23420 [Coleofasciculaceae cyanobacterium]